MKMCQAMAYNGHQVTLLVSDVSGGEKKVKDSYAFYGVKRSFSIIKMAWPPLPGKNFIFSILASLKAKSLNPDFVYSRHLTSAFFCSILRIPIVFESHTILYNYAKLERWMFLRLLNSRSLKRVVVISEALKQLYKNMGIDDKRFLVAHDGADAVIEEEAIKNKAGKISVGYIGHLYAGRGMEIIAAIASRCAFADFYIIGGTEKDIAFWKAILAAQTNIFFHGFLTPSEVEKHRSSFDVLLAPYQKKVTVAGRGDTSEFMSPLKIFEYMAARKPIVVSDLPVLREVFNEKNSILVGPEDIDGWVDALERLKNQELRDAISRQAYEDFIANYTWDKRSQKVLNGLNC
jgi:glycosyltransferase involved in cell wall biosynthesis